MYILIYDIVLIIITVLVNNAYNDSTKVISLEQKNKSL